ncbi:MAG: DUF721 domain-containing protein [Rhodospirillaceae bacterium]
MPHHEMSTPVVQGVLLPAWGLAHARLMTPSAKDADAAPRLARGPVKIAGLASRAARPALGKRGFAAAEILTHWETVVGPELAAFACPLEIKFPRGRNDGATLHLRIASGGAATLLHMKTPTILARVNGFIGYGAVSSIQVAQGPLPKGRKRAPPVEPKETPTTLTDALAKLRAAVEQRTRTRR